jgi:hypothetical protein
MTASERPPNKPIPRWFQHIVTAVFFAMTVYAAWPLIDLQRLSGNEPVHKVATGLLEVSLTGFKQMKRVELIDNQNMHTTYSCDLVGYKNTTCIPELTPQPLKDARVEYVEMPEGIDSSAHRMPLRITVDGKLEFERTFAQAISVARYQRLVLVVIPVAIGIFMLWAFAAQSKRLRRQGS